MKMHRLEEFPDLRWGEDRRWLIENQQTYVPEEQAEDLQPLLIAHRQLPHWGQGIEREIVLLGQFLKTNAGAFQIEHRLVHRRQAQNNILQRGQVVHQHEVLVDHPDAEVNRCPRRGNLHLSSVEVDLAGIWMVEAIQYVHQRGLAGTILTQQAVNLPRAYL